jgi:CDP-diacylglycerol--serine O-phosphatidyltransferase
MVAILLIIHIEKILKRKSYRSKKMEEHMDKQKANSNFVKKYMEKMFIGIYNKSCFLTFLGLVLAIIGMVLAMKNYHLYAVCAIILCGICDGFDGTIASKMKRDENAKLYGIQLDTLSDTIAFGVLPIIILYEMGYNGIFSIIAYCVYICAVVIRLAYFNVLSIDEARKKRLFFRYTSNYNGYTVPNNIYDYIKI